MSEDVTEPAVIMWKPVSLVARRVVDVDGDLVTLEFNLDVPDDKSWYQCFAQARGPERQGSSVYVSTNPQFLTAEVLSWKVELTDIPDAVNYLVGRVNEANTDFTTLLERKEQIRRQLEMAALRRQQAIAEAQRLLDESWPEEPPSDDDEASANGSMFGQPITTRPEPEEPKEDLSRYRKEYASEHLLS